MKNPPVMQETWIRSLGWEGLLRREQLPTPVSWPGEFHGLYSPWGCKESDTTERLSLHKELLLTLTSLQPRSNSKLLSPGRRDVTVMSQTTTATSCTVFVSMKHPEQALVQGSPGLAGLLPSQGLGRLSLAPCCLLSILQPASSEEDVNY